MPFKQIASPDARYLASTDILIGDMSDINYEFLLYNRPIILLANDWINSNWPDIGIKTSLYDIETAIERTLVGSDEFEDARKEWLGQTIFEPYEDSSSRILGIATEKSGLKSPKIVVIHGNSEVRRTNLQPLHEAAVRDDLSAEFIPFSYNNGDVNTVYFAAHFEDFNFKTGYKIHLDHGLKGKGAANVEMSVEDYKIHNYFPQIDLHITAGEHGNNRTRMQLGPNAGRAVIGGYPKADHLLQCDTIETKEAVFRELKFDLDKPLITYASAGPLSYAKPGGSFCPEVIDKLKDVSENLNVNILIKLKYSKPPIFVRAIDKFRRKYNRLLSVNFFLMLTMLLNFNE